LTGVKVNAKTKASREVQMMMSPNFLSSIIGRWQIELSNILSAQGWSGKGSNQFRGKEMGLNLRNSYPCSIDSVDKG
jgi:hypothetical protein